ncbi:MAG: YbaB/EbfC family nucleoid-associated protein [Nitritalea sp.]
MFDMMGMMNKVKEAQAKMKEVQDNLVHVQAEGEAGAGMVRAVVNGKRQVLSLEVDASLLNPADREMVQDLSVAAVNHALAAVEIKIKEEMKQATQGMLPNIPGMNLSDMFG